MLHTTARTLHATFPVESVNRNFLAYTTVVYANVYAIPVIQQQNSTHPTVHSLAQSATSGQSESCDNEVSRPINLGMEIRSLNNLISRYLGATMPENARAATGGNARIIMFLAKNEHRDIFQYDIEERCSITPSTASRVLSLMEKKGLIERQAVERDARLRRIVLTDAAQEIVDALRRNAEKMKDTLFAQFTEEDLAQLSSYFAMMRSNLTSTGLVGNNCVNAKNLDKSSGSPSDTPANNGSSNTSTTDGRSN